MKKIIFFLSLILGVSVGFAEKPDLGLRQKTFDVEVSEPGKEPTPDRLIFRKGRFISLDLKEKGFKRADVDEKNKTEETTFKAIQSESSVNVAKWTGLVRKDPSQGIFVSGTLVRRTQEKGNPKTQSFFFSGKLLGPLYERLGGDKGFEKVWAKLAENTPLPFKAWITYWLTQVEPAPDPTQALISKKDWAKTQTAFMDLLEELEIPEWDLKELDDLIEEQKEAVWAMPESLVK